MAQITEHIEGFGYVETDTRRLAYVAERYGSLSLAELQDLVGERIGYSMATPDYVVRADKGECLLMLADATSAAEIDAPPVATQAEARFVEIRLPEPHDIRCSYDGCETAPTVWVDLFDEDGDPVHGGLAGCEHHRTLVAVDRLIEAGLSARQALTLTLAAESVRERVHGGQ